MPLVSEIKGRVYAVVPGEDGGISLYPSLWKHPPTPATSSHTALSQRRMLPRVELNTFCSTINDRSIYLFISFIHMCIQWLGHFFPLPPAHYLTPSPPAFQAGTVLPLSGWRESININKEDQGFLLVEVRIAI
jgi:hypothetical protein